MWRVDFEHESARVVEVIEMQTNQYQSTVTAGLTVIAGLLLLAGCATTAPTPTFKPVPASTSKPDTVLIARSAPSATPPQEESKPAIVCANDTVKVRVETASGVSIGNYRKAQLAQQIQERLDAKKALNRTNGEDRQFEVTVTLTSFKTGSSLGRLISGRMGQIDIDSTVQLHDLTAGKQLSEFSIRENFTRGGIGGFSTSYSDAEYSFADGVAVALTGQASPRSTNSNEWTLR